MKIVYGPTLRQTEGFVAPLLEMMELEKKMPASDYMTLSKRQGDLEIEIERTGKTSQGPPRKRLKYVEMKNLCCRSLGRLKTELRRAEERVRQKAQIIQSFFWKLG